MNEITEYKLRRMTAREIKGTAKGLRATLIVERDVAALGYAGYTDHSIFMSEEEARSLHKQLGAWFKKNPTNARAKLQTAKAPAAKIATCISAVPAVLSPTGAAIKKGTKISYIKTTFRNGEGHLILAGKKSVPDVFFEL